ncbi:ATP synthase subunit delta, mitochondrial [Patagioenas fasciata monilis]|uniref:ATP synthase F(1) complex subunit delta, mitochondrial n=1 Tax=Patagioenas fasciata monilis TaxID=372326 RepID=A0A1V4KQA6_PATFA|nr:ATP synthase subunit delta, mitochondrial [Patagioenas fasciata monilis]
MELAWVSLVFYNGANVKQVDVPTLTGSFGILASHVPTLQVLKPGVVTVYAEDGTATKYFVSSGSVTVHADSTVQVLAEEAVTMDMLDLATAKSNLEKAPWSNEGIPVLMEETPDCPTCPGFPACTDGAGQMEAEKTL